MKSLEEIVFSDADIYALKSKTKSVSKWIGAIIGMQEGVISFLCRLNQLYYKVHSIWNQLALCQSIKLSDLRRLNNFKNFSEIYEWMMEKTDEL